MLTFLAIAGLIAATAQAVTIDLVPVGNPGNANDTETGSGSVSQSYSIGKYEITNAQWREFLTAKASTSDLYGLYDTAMAGTYGGIDHTWSVDHYVYTAKGGDANWDNRPVNYVSFWDAARFCNWLHNGQGNGDTEHGAYENIGNQSTFARQPGAKYFIPTENEWYKAAYYDPNKGGARVPGYWDYPMMSDRPTVPSNDLINPDPGNNANFYISPSDYTIGSPYYTTKVGEFENSESPYGTYDQGGNVSEWIETVIENINPLRGVCGGNWTNVSGSLLAYYPSSFNPTDEDSVIGFRVASVPEPGSIILVVSGAIAGLIWRRRRK
jgi:formylglycine-generating enzyme required for sulfatase activity